MTPCPMTRMHLAEFRFFARAALEHPEALVGGCDLDGVFGFGFERELARAMAARVELAAAGEARGVGNGAGDLLQPAPLIAELGNGAEETLGVRVLRVIKQLFDRRDFDHPAG